MSTLALVRSRAKAYADLTLQKIGAPAGDANARSLGVLIEAAFLKAYAEGTDDLMRALAQKGPFSLEGLTVRASAYAVEVASKIGASDDAGDGVRQLFEAVFVQGYSTGVDDTLRDLPEE